MRPLDFEYHKPAALWEAVGLFRTLSAAGKAPLYYTGGTELITLSRLGLIRTGAVIDLKGIPECGVLRMEAERLVIGAAVSLNELDDADLFPLLGRSAGQVADRTARNKITLGGNLCSDLIYREAVLPLLLADATVTLAGPAGVRRASIHRVFDQRLHLLPGELLVQVQVHPLFTQLPFFYTKRRRSGNVGYPVATLAALRKDGRLRIALTGLCEFPFRSRRLEAFLGQRTIPAAVRAERASALLPAPLLDDPEASAEYRAFVLRSALLQALQALEGVND